MKLLHPLLVSSVVSFEMMLKLDGPIKTAQVLLIELVKFAHVSPLALLIRLTSSVFTAYTLIFPE